MRETEFDEDNERLFGEVALLALELPPLWRALELHQILRRVRRLNRTSQNEIARATGMTQAAISRVESGRVDAKWGTWQRLFQACGADIVLVVTAVTDEAVIEDCSRSEVAADFSQMGG